MSVVAPVSGTRWTLRTKLIALVIGFAAFALIAVDVVLPEVVRGTQLDTEDATLTSVMAAVPQTVTVIQLHQLTAANPLRGGLGWSVVTTAGIAQVLPSTTSDSDDGPRIPQNPSTDPQTVPALDSTGTYRILARGLESGGYLVVWTPLRDVTASLRRLILIEILITTGLLILLGAIAGLVIRRELRPLEAMATAADDIAAGDLSRRVTEADPGTEVGRLGAAFNDMLDGIGGLLEDRTRGEERLRQFIADASHELRTPVAAVRGYAELYRAGALPNDAAVDRAMERMGFEAARMGALVEDLLTLIAADAQERGTREPVGLANLLAGAVDDAAVIDPSRTWRLVGLSANVTVLGDRLRLHQLFANLLANVRTHTPAGTVATVAVLPGVDEVAVSVSDNGPGVGEADLPRLFDRFYRAEKSRTREKGGTGLGLSIVAAIASAHGGRVLAANAAGGGLTVTVVLPRATGTAAVPVDLPQLGGPPAEV